MQHTHHPSPDHSDAARTGMKATIQRNTAHSSLTATIEGMNTPSATPVQLGTVAAFAAAVVAVITAGIDGTDLRVFMVCLTVLAVALIVADAMIRRGRAGIEANRALVTPPADPKVNVDVKADA